MSILQRCNSMSTFSLKSIIKLRVMLTSVFRVLVNNPVKKSFYEEKKKVNNVLTVFFIFHKNDVKTF